MKRKILGIGIFLMLISITMILPVTAKTDFKTITRADDECRPIETISIDEIFQKYEDELIEINAYIEEYGIIDENFVLPENLQVEFESLIDELSYILIKSKSSLDWGETKVEWFWWGLYWGVKIWLNWYHTKMLDFLGPWGVGFTAFYLSWITGGH